jgi:hypothetical protein
MPHRDDLSAFENLGVGVAQIAMDGSWVANRRLRELLGFAHDGFAAIPFDRFFESDNLGSETQERKRLLGGRNSELFVGTKRDSQRRMPALGQSSLLGRMG